MRTRIGIAVDTLHLQPRTAAWPTARALVPDAVEAWRVRLASAPRFGAAVRGRARYATSGGITTPTEATRTVAAAMTPTRQRQAVGQLAGGERHETWAQLNHGMSTTQGNAAARQTHSRAPDAYNLVLFAQTSHSQSLNPFLHYSVARPFCETK